MDANQKVKIGDVVDIEYLDHVFYKDLPHESTQTPRRLRAFGLLVYQDDLFIRIRFESCPDPDSSDKAKARYIGLVILRSAIVEMRKANA